MTWVDLALMADSPDDGFSKIRLSSYLLNDAALSWACASFFLRYPEHWVSSGPFSAQDSIRATIPGLRFFSHS